MCWSRLKSSIFKSLINIGSSDEQIAELLRIWRNEDPPSGMTLSNRDYIELAFELALRLPDEAIDILDSQRERIENEDELRRFDFIAQALQPDAASRDQFFESPREAQP